MDGVMNEEDETISDRNPTKNDVELERINARYVFSCEVVKWAGMSVFALCTALSVYFVAKMLSAFAGQQTTVQIGISAALTATATCTGLAWLASWKKTRAQKKEIETLRERCESLEKRRKPS